MKAFALSWRQMSFPIRVCVICHQEFELKPDKPGFANRCPECSEPEEIDLKPQRLVSAFDHQSEPEANEARRKAIRDMLYRTES
jgi:hypothetical protein